MSGAEIAAARVRLRALRDDDFDAVAEIVADDEVMRFLRDGFGLSGEEAEELFDEILSDAVGPWAIEDRRDGEFLGYLRLRAYDTRVVELECVVKRSRWRRGFATEAARAAMLYAFDTLGVNRVVAEMHPANRGGQRLMEKIGMSHREDNQDSHGLKMYVFAITALERRMLRGH